MEGTSLLSRFICLDHKQGSDTSNKICDSQIIHYHPMNSTIRTRERKRQIRLEDADISQNIVIQEGDGTVIDNTDTGEVSLRSHMVKGATGS